MTVDGNDELSRLGRSINRMVDAMQKSQQALQIRQQEEERLRLTIESVAEAIASTDLEGKIIDVNDSKIKLHGYSNKLELVGHNALELVSSEDLPKAKENMRMALETGYSDGGEYTMLKKDGTTFSAERSTALLKNPEGKPAGFVISTKDITERRRTEEALTLSEQNFRNSLNNSPMGVTIADGDFNTVYVNQTFLDIFGYKNLGEVKASPPQEHYTPGSYAEYLKRREQRSRGEPNPDSVEIDVIRQDGTIRHLQIFLKNVLWDGKQQYQTLYTDITERKEATDQLARLNAELKSFNSQLESKVQERTSQLEEAVSVAEASNQAKSEFLASMSHELRTPLNAIIGFSEVLRERYFGDLNPKQSEYIVDIVDSGKHLLSLINDILDLSKIEAGKMDLELSRFKIADLLRSSLVMIKEKALAHNLTLDIQIPDDINELLITADERRIKQVMFNLLSNSAKFTPDGGSIKLEAHYQGADLVISVSDTGIGMTSQEQKRLFEAFYQASGGIKGKTPGTGLGLAITRSIIEKHGGKIWMESKGTNMGSTFTFTLPVKALTPADIV
jgi:PAS domain S-box-containing protein